MNKNTIKPEMTVEAKARFFALYWGQKIQSYKLTYSWKRDVEVSGTTLGFLTLKPLSSITDEDAIEVAKIIHGKEDNLRFKISMGYERENGEATHDSVICVEVSLFIPYPEDGRFYLHQLVQFDTEENDVIVGCFTNDGQELSDDHCDNILHVYDFLRSKGYALPFMGRSVDQMVEEGWIKLKGGSSNGNV